MTLFSLRCSQLPRSRCIFRVQPLRFSKNRTICTRHRPLVQTATAPQVRVRQAEKSSCLKRQKESPKSEQMHRRQNDGAEIFSDGYDVTSTEFSRTTNSRIFLYCRPSTMLIPFFCFLDEHAETTNTLLVSFHQNRVSTHSN